MKKLFIVSVYRPDLLDEAMHAAGVSRDVKVFVDRRVGERRQPERARSEETRRNERRQRSVDETLRVDGFALVAEKSTP